MEHHWLGVRWFVSRLIEDFEPLYQTTSLMYYCTSILSKHLCLHFCGKIPIAPYLFHVIDNMDLLTIILLPLSMVLDIASKSLILIQNTNIHQQHNWLGSLNPT